MFEKNEISEKESIKYPEEKGRYNIYYDRKKTIKCPQLLSEEDAEYAKQHILDIRRYKEFEELNLENSKFKEEVEKTKERIGDFGTKIGIANLKDRLDNVMVYLLSEKIYKEIRPNSSEGERGFAVNNEILTKKQSETELDCHTLQHELLHLACKENFYLEKKGKDYNFNPVSSGFGGLSLNKNRKFDTFNEGVTETTNQQIYFENNDFAPTTYHIESVIFVTELAKDISQRTGEKMTVEKTLEHFQKGMFKGKRKYLKIIKDVYGEEALRELANMENETNDIIRVSKIFNLSIAIDKINKFRKSEKIRINVCNNSFTVELKP